MVNAPPVLFRLSPSLSHTPILVTQTLAPDLRDMLNPTHSTEAAFWRVSRYMGLS